MDLSTYIQEFRESLQSAAALGDEHTQKSAAALAGAVDPAARLALIHALSDMAAEVTRQLNDTAEPGEQFAVDIRLAGRDVQVGTSRNRSSSFESGSSGSAGSATSASSAAASSSAASSSSSGPGGVFGGAFSKGHGDVDAGHRSFTDASGDLTRTTVRMFNQLKSEAEKAASEQGVSLNSFISRAVADSIRPEFPKRWNGRFNPRHDGPGRPDGTESTTTISGYVQG